MAEERAKYARFPRVLELYDLSRSGVYKLASEGKIRMVKDRGTTLVDLGSVDRHFARLPTAPLRTVSEHFRDVRRKGNAKRRIAALQ